MKTYKSSLRFEQVGGDNYQHDVFHLGALIGYVEKKDDVYNFVPQQDGVIKELSGFQNFHRIKAALRVIYDTKVEIAFDKTPGEPQEEDVLLFGRLIGYITKTADVYRYIPKDKDAGKYTSSKHLDFLKTKILNLYTKPQPENDKIQKKKLLGFLKDSSRVVELNLGDTVGRIKLTKDGQFQFVSDDGLYISEEFPKLDELKSDVRELYGYPDVLSDFDKTRKPIPPPSRSEKNQFWFSKVEKSTQKYVAYGLGLLTLLWVYFNAIHVITEKTVRPSSERILVCEGDICTRYWKQCIDDMWYVSQRSGDDVVKPYRDSHGVHQRCG